MILSLEPSLQNIKNSEFVTKYAGKINIILKFNLIQIQDETELHNGHFVDLCLGTTFDRHGDSVNNTERCIVLHLCIIRTRLPFSREPQQRHSSRHKPSQGAN